MTLTLALIVAACSNDGTATPTTVPTQYEADQVMIRDLWDGYTQRWAEGRPAAFQYIEAHNHPDLGFSAADFECAYAELPDDFREVTTVDERSAIRDDGWAWPGSSLSPSPIDGEVPRGRLYTVDVEQAFVTPGFDPIQELRELHVAVIGDAAYFFLAPNC